MKVYDLIQSIAGADAHSDVIVTDEETKTKYNIEYVLIDKDSVEIKCTKIVEPHFIKCGNCTGTGFVQVAPNARGVMKCPCCNGIGKVEVIFR